MGCMVKYESFVVKCFIKLFKMSPYHSLICLFKRPLRISQSGVSLASSPVLVKFICLTSNLVLQIHTQKEPGSLLSLTSTFSAFTSTRLLAAKLWGLSLWISPAFVKGPDGLFQGPFEAIS